MTATQSHAKKAAQTIEENTGRIREDLRTIKEDSLTLARDLKEDGLEAARSVSNDVKDKMGSLKSQAAAQMKSVEKEVKAHPLQSMAIAFAAGALASLFLGRR